MSKRRRFSGELKAKIALEALRGDRTLQEIASKHQVHPNQVSAWKGVVARIVTGPHDANRQDSSPADAIRHWSAEGGHPIEDFAAEDHLTPLPGWAPGAKAISDDGFVSEERILHPALTMVP